MAIARQQIFVVMPTHLWCFRELLRGIGAFGKAAADWRIRYFTPRDNFVELIRIGRPDGVMIGNLMGQEAFEGPSQNVLANVPHVVGVCENLVDHGIHGRWSIGVDSLLVGRIAAEHFLQKKYTSFAFIGFDFGWSGERLTGFRQTLNAAGFEPATLFPNWESFTLGRGWQIAHPNAEIGPFLKSLPKPLAVLACNDLRGREIIEACQDVGLDVPEDVAIMGVDNDPLDCELTSPELSSVSIPWERIGFQAAGTLYRLLAGDPVPPDTQHQPGGIIERRSTDRIAISDPDVLLAMRYIRDRGHLPITVDDVRDAVATGRRTLEKRFKSVLGRTLLDEIRRVHIERAKDLLASTSLPISEVADRSGFADVTWFSTSFKRLSGMSPLAFRQRFKR